VCDSTNQRITACTVGYHDDHCLDILAISHQVFLLARRSGHKLLRGFCIGIEIEHLLQSASEALMHRRPLFSQFPSVAKS
jgi:hypothetical protein